MGRRASRVDDNQREIMDALRRAGAGVVPLHTVGMGCPDLLVGHRGQNYLLEVKDGRKAPSARRLTSWQEKWHVKWDGQACVVKDVDEALEAIGIELRGEIR